jgi:cytochrome P450
MLDLLSDATLRDPFPAYAQLRAAPPFQEPRSGHWLLLGHAAVRRALTDHEAFSSAAVAGPERTARWLIFNDPPRHGKLRALLTRAFTPRALAALEPRIRALSAQLLAAQCLDASERAELDLVADYAVPLPLRVIAEMFGAPAQEYPRFRGWSDAMLALASSVARADDAAQAESRFAATSDEMERYLAPLIEARRARPQDDLLTGLVHAELDGERLSRADLLGFFQLLLLAGHETTTNFIANAVLCLTEHPEQLARLRATPALLDSAIEEILRYRSPVQTTFRRTRHALKLEGQTLPAGALVLAVIGSANRDPRAFPDPERFDIARQPNAHLAFGHGIHFCLGAVLARIEARVALSDLLWGVSALERTEVGPWQPRRAFHVHGPASLRVRFGRRASASAAEPPQPGHGTDEAP